ncbi:MAG TPA: putative lipid II flippase FtsW [Thermoanaerobaculia bacterium]
MARKLATDKVLFVPLVALSLFGCVMIYSASAVSSAETSGSPYRYLVKQFAALVVGGIVAFVVSRADYRIFASPWVVYLAYGGAFLLCVFALLQPPINSARRWIPVGPVMFQPSEFLKVALVVLLAAQIARKTLAFGDPEKAIKPVLFFSLAAAGVVLLEPDLGTAACYMMLGGVLLWIAGVRAKLFLMLGAGALPLVIAAAFAASYRRARVLSFLRPEADPLGAGFQALQSLIAVGAGGLFGNGLGASRQKLFFLPYPHTDFIFAIVGEELGFIGSVGVIACFAVIAWRGFRAARRAPDAFGGLLAAGATAMLVVQAAVNVSVVLAIMPTKGIPLPFVSYGGSSLVASWLAAGLILNVSQHEVETRET